LGGRELSPLRVPLSCGKIKRFYDTISWFYDAVTGYEATSMKTALNIADIRENATVLEVGFGTGKGLAEIGRRVGSHGGVFGLDISPRMAKIARKRVQSADMIERVNLILGDAENTPFRNGTFDLVFASYLLDLIDTPKISLVLSEYWRALKRSGQLVLVSLSKGPKWYDNMRLYEWLYRHFPTLCGGCRPLQLSPYLENLGFNGIKRHFMHAAHLMPIEIVSATKCEPQDTKR
jgi:ubiquinone/menaquinone biosynthesis C-methylase UbiE